ncbi:hypothetical protein [Acutalibacter muris]|uniref:hypothetical protein n=1 Tax=Acutalibacter muris TaxID=1796620 RepID=UPI001C3ED53C|nr:hypothetical protein [Acutalibacter muris]
MLSPKMLGSEEPDMPGKNEIWITTKIANILGLAAGDSVSLQLADKAVTVNVAKIVADRRYGGLSKQIFLSRLWKIRR